MSKAYRVSKRTVMFDKKNPKTVYSVSPVNYGTLSTEDVANQIAAESSATPGDVKNVLDRYAYYVKENLKKGYQIQLLGFGYLSLRFITSGTAKTEKEATAKLIQSLVPSFIPSAKGTHKENLSIRTQCLDGIGDGYCGKDVTTSSSATNDYS